MCRQQEGLEDETFEADMKEQVGRRFSEGERLCQVFPSFTTNCQLRLVTVSD